MEHSRRSSCWWQSPSSPCSLPCFFLLCENDGRQLRVCPDSHSAWDWWRAISAGYSGKLQPIDQRLTKRQWRDGRRHASVCGVNYWIHDCQHWDTSQFAMPHYWQRTDATRNLGHVPVLLGGPRGWTTLFPTDGPPSRGDPCGGVSLLCDPRRSSFVNGVFMDWSVRKVGLKEPWALEWHRQFGTGGPWMKAGGVRPENWPG